MEEGGGSREEGGIPGTVGAIAEVYLGNLLYALERCALALAGEGNAEGAAYYRALARELAEARGRQTAP